MKLSGILVAYIFVVYCNTGSQALSYCSHLDKVCLLPKETGPCRGSFKKFYFDSNIGQCRSFTYGGCEGNDNRFDTLKECQKRCPSTTPICLQPKVTGPCKGYFPRYYFNSCTGRCERFIYGGCQGNQNNFHTINQCYKSCPCNQFDTIPPVTLHPICYLPEERGTCKGYLPRYFYNKCTRKCQLFIYGGCFGNKNNFKSYKDCDSVCHYPMVKG